MENDIDLNKLIQEEKEKMQNLSAENSTANIAPLPFVVSKKLSQDEMSIKNINSISLSDIEVNIDKTKSMSEQAEEVLDVATLAETVKDEHVRADLKEQKAHELTDKAKSKANKAKEESITSETDVQKAQRSLYEAVLETFGITKHLPQWLMKILVVIFSPIYTILSLIIGIPCGFMQILINNLNGIFVTYGKTDDKVKPRIKVIWWIILALLVIGIICLTVLKCLGRTI